MIWIDPDLYEGRHVHIRQAHQIYGVDTFAGVIFDTFSGVTVFPKYNI
jgi:hypothetical protein